MDNFFHKEIFNEKNPIPSYSDYLPDEASWGIRNLNLYQTPEI